MRNLDGLHFEPQKEIFFNPPVAALVEHAITRGEGTLSSTGALVARTFERTGRSPKDKFVVRDAKTDPKVWWEQNQETSPELFEELWQQASHHLEQNDVFVTDSWACADPDHRLGVRLVSELAWHSLFARQLFRRPTPDELDTFTPEWTVLGAPNFKARKTDGLNSSAFVAVDFTNTRVLIIGTHYAGEIKKSIFTVLNYLLPGGGVLPMHCSANVGVDGDVALFFGLSGTGKTTLSADPERSLIGDDEHGWSNSGVFNFEGGCYAKCIRLSPHKEPQIFDAIRFGAVVENVVVDPETAEVNYDDDSITENTRAAYPLDFMPGATPSGMAGHARTIIFLTADAFGVLPPIARLSHAQAAYHFLSGFTSKLAGTEAGLGDEPEATFSTCFGAPFLPLHPTVYAKMLIKKLEAHDAKVYLVNTGWSGGPYGIGSRIDLAATRAIVSAAVSGKLSDTPTRTDPIFNIEVPLEVEGVTPETLSPRDTWEDPAAYDASAKELASKFEENFEKFRDHVDPAVRDAGPTP